MAQKKVVFNRATFNQVAFCRVVFYASELRNVQEELLWHGVSLG